MSNCRSGISIVTLIFLLLIAVILYVDFQNSSEEVSTNSEKPKINMEKTRKLEQSQRMWFYKEVKHVLGILNVFDNDLID